MRYCCALGFASVVLAIILVGCSDQREQIADQNEAADDRVGTIPIFELRTNDCFVDRLGLFEASLGELGELLEVTLLSCSDAAADIRVTRLFVINQNGTWPGFDFMEEEARTGCPGFGGQSDDIVTFFYPTRESWELDDRTITCLRSLR